MGERSNTFLKTFTNEDLAYDFMRRRNASDRHNFLVLVDGPNDGEWTVMDIRTAIESDFPYQWA